MRIFFIKSSPVKLQFLIWGFVFLFTFLTYLPEDGFGQALTWGVMNIGFYALLIYGNISLLYPRLYEKGRITAYVAAALGLLLSALGIYAVLSFAVNQRTQEIGVRLALGAKPGDVLKMVVGDGLRLFAMGLAVGVAAALALSRLMSHLLFGVSAGDPTSYVSVMAILAVVTLLACYLPARRAMRVQPMSALRYE